MLALTIFLFTIQFLMLTEVIVFKLESDGRSIVMFNTYLSLVLAILTLLSLSYVSLEYTIYLGVLYLIIYIVYFLIKILSLITE